MNKKNLVFFILVICLVSFLIPFLLRDNEAKLLDTIAISFTALSAIATVSTLIIAILLYQQFNIDSLVIEHQTSKVLELIDYLKGKVVYIGIGEGNYLSRFSVDDESLYNSKFYKEMSGMALVTRAEDFDQFINKIIDISNSYWMPKEIKDKIEFLKITGFMKELNPNEIKFYAKLKFTSKENADDEWLIITPNLYEFQTNKNETINLNEAEFLVNDYIASKNLLIKTIIKWLDEKSNIKLELNLREPGQGFMLK